MCTSSCLYFFCLQNMPEGNVKWDSNAHSPPPPPPTVHKSFFNLLSEFVCKGWNSWKGGRGGGTNQTNEKTKKKKPHTQKIDMKLSHQWAQKRITGRVSGVLLKKWCRQSRRELLAGLGFQWLRVARRTRGDLGAVQTSTEAAPPSPGRVSAAQMKSFHVSMWPLSSVPAFPHCPFWTLTRALAVGLPPSSPDLLLGGNVCEESFSDAAGILHWV